MAEDYQKVCYTCLDEECVKKRNYMLPSNDKVSDALKEILHLDIFSLPAGIKICTKCARTLRFIYEATRKKEEFTSKFFGAHGNTPNQLKRPASPSKEQKRARIKLLDNTPRVVVG